MEEQKFYYIGRKLEEGTVKENEANNRDDLGTNPGNGSVYRLQCKISGKHLARVLAKTGKDDEGSLGKLIEKGRVALLEELEGCHDKYVGRLVAPARVPTFQQDHYEETPEQKENIFLAVGVKVPDETPEEGDVMTIGGEKYRIVKMERLTPLGDARRRMLKTIEKLKSGTDQVHLLMGISTDQGMTMEIVDQSLLYRRDLINQIAEEIGKMAENAAFKNVVVKPGADQKRVKRMRPQVMGTEKRRKAS